MLGFSVALRPDVLWYGFLGCLVGTLVGVLPGIGPLAGISILLPITFGLDATKAIVMLAGIYYGSQYGGSTTSILMRIPGEASFFLKRKAAYEMAKKGRAGAALAIAAVGSFIAGTFGVVGMTLFSLPLTSFALKFGPAEYFCLMLLAMTSVASLTGSSPAKGLLATILGLMLATIGTDLQSGQSRFTFGVADFSDGIGFVPVVVGMFAVAEVLRALEGLHRGDAPPPMRISGRLWLTPE